jgi:hypothetical protein
MTIRLQHAERLDLGRQGGRARRHRRGWRAKGGCCSQPWGLPPVSPSSPA